MKPIKIEDLKHENRLATLAHQSIWIERTVGMKLKERIFFGCKIYKSFGMTFREATQHKERDLLLTRGCELEVKR